MKEYEEKEKKRAVEQLEKENKYKELYEKVNNELEPTKKDLERLQKLETTVKNKLLDQLPKEKRSIFEVLTIEQLEAITENLPTSKGTTKDVKDVELAKSSAESNLDFNVKQVLREAEGGSYDKKKIAEMARKLDFKAQIIN